MDRTPDAQGFRHLWPTVFLQRELPGAEAANRVLAETILAADAKAADLTLIVARRDE